MPFFDAFRRTKPGQKLQQDGKTIVQNAVFVAGTRLDAFTTKDALWIFSPVIQPLLHWRRMEVALFQGWFTLTSTGFPRVGSSWVVPAQDSFGSFYFHQWDVCTGTRAVIPVGLHKDRGRDPGLGTMNDFSGFQGVITWGNPLAGGDCSSVESQSHVLQ